jgi:hypothetical protein
MKTVNIVFPMEPIIIGHIMHPRGLNVSLALAILLISGCAATPATFYAESATMSDVRLCRTLKSALAGNDSVFAEDVRRAAAARNYDEYSCQAIVNRQNAAIAVGVVAAAAVVAIAKNGGGGGVGASTTTGAGYDTEWDWDQFNNQYNQPVWACRGVQTGQYSEAYHCNGKMQSDWRWPQK